MPPRVELSGPDGAALLGPEGPLARHISGFAPRAPQQDMAQAVADALLNDGVLISEAGTGTGKTYAYLVPALMSGKKIIISTGTKNLQDQLYHRDLPRCTHRPGCVGAYRPAQGARQLSVFIPPGNGRA